MDRKFVEYEIKNYYRLSIIIIFSCFILWNVTNIIAATQNVTFELTKSVDNTTPEINRSFTYTIFYRCASLTETHCNDMVVTDQLSDDLEFISATEGAHPATITEFENLVTFTFDQPVPAGSTGQLAITVRIPLSAGVNSGDVIANTATIDASNASGPLDSNPVNVTPTVGSDPARYKKDGGSTTAAVDTDFEYQLVINPASSVVTNATIVDYLPTGSVYISCLGGDNCNYDSTNHRVTWTDVSVTDWTAYRVTIQFPSSTFSDGDVIVNNADFDFTDGSTPVSATESENTTIASATPVIDVQKWAFLGSDIWGSQDVKIGEEAGYPYGINNSGTADLANVVVTDIFPAEFDFTRIKTPRFNSPYPTGLVLYYGLNGSGSWTQFPASAYSNGTGADPATQEMITLADLGISAPDEVTGFRVEIATMEIGIGTSNGLNGVVYGTINTNAIGSSTVENCISGTGDSSDPDSHCSSVNITVSDVAALDSYKWVKGLDELGFVNPINSDVCEDNGQGYTRYPCVAQTVQGGIADYQLVLENPGTINMTDIILIDILPFIGDTGVLVTATRDTEWRPNLAGPVTAPAGVAVYYSTSSNPCRGEVGGPTTGCDAPNWSTTPPTDITTVGSLKFDFGTIEIAPGEQFILTWPMRVPNGTPTDEIAWNSFAYVTSRADDGVQLLPSEPPKVGIITKVDLPNTYGDYIWLDTNRDGIQDGGETGINGVQIDLYEDVNGTPNDFTDDLHIGFTVSGNDGTGNPGYYLFPYLPDGDYYAVATPPTIYSISPVDASGDGGANDTTDAEDDSDFDPTTLRTPITNLGPRDVALAEEIDLSWDLGVYLLGPSIQLEKTVYTGHDSGASCPGVELVQAATGADVTYCFVITNNGKTDLDDIVFADATLGITGADVVSPIITSTILAQGNSMTVYYETASLGTITNTATVDGRPVDGSGDPIVDPDSGDPIDRPSDNDTAATEEVSAMVMIGDRVWTEDDNDGNATTGTVTPVVGRTVIATASDGTTYTDVTDVSGNYAISVPADSVYTVTVSTPAGTTPAGTLITTDSDPATQNDLSHDGSGTVVTVDTNDNLTIDFGFYQPPPPPPCGDDPDDLGGTIWRDYNSDGTQDANELGFDGVTVTAYDNDGNGVTATVNADGTYNFSDIFATETHIRLEFSGLPGWMESGVHGANSGTTVQRHSAATCGADLAVQNPADYCDSMSSMVTSCFVFGGHTDVGQDALGAMVTWENDPALADEGRNNYVAYIDEIGATTGLAYQTTTDLIYAGAFAKRYADWGPNGSGAIYVINNQAINPGDPSNVTQVITIPNAGTTARATNGWLRDTDFFDRVGKEGLGDLALSDDETALWTINLNNRHLYVVDVDTDSINYGSVQDLGEIADPGCAGGANDWRPFALEFHDGALYVGGVCSGETDNTDPVKFSTTDYQQVSAGTDLTANLAVHVLEVTAPLASSATVITYSNTDLQYNRGVAVPAVNGGNAVGRWHPWVSEWNISRIYQNNGDNPPSVAYPQPMLTDLEFDSDGSLIFGFRDRFADQIGISARAPGTNSPNDPDTDTAMYSARSGGDINRACRDGGTWHWEAQGSTACPTNGNSPTEADNGANESNEFYTGEYYLIHAETAQGGLFLIHGTGQIATTAMDPHDLYSGGVLWLDNETGSADYNYEVFKGGNPLFSKANGLGDLEGLCAAAPLEIGNYVWMDDDGDGIQDPCELAIANVDVVLTAADGSTQTTTTDANGEYYFTVDPNSAYTLTIDMTQPALITATLTTPNVDAGTTLTDGIDSDGIANGNLAVITLTTGDAGENDHTFDFGFVPEIPQVMIGDRVWIEDDNDGNATTGVTTPVTNTVVTAVASNGTVYTDTTDAMGYYTITVPANDVYTVTVSTPSGMVPSSTLITSDNDPNSDNNLSHDGSGTVVTVATEDNLTIDFGFYEPALAASHTPVCPAGALLWENNIDTDSLQGSHGAPQADVRFVGNNVVSYTLPIALPAAFSGPVDIDISEAVAWDGYQTRANTGDQPNERFAVLFMKNGNLEWQSTWTGVDGTDDGIATGVTLDDWTGSLGAANLPNGADEIVLIHWGEPTYGNNDTSANSVVPCSVCIEYTLPAPPMIMIGDRVWIEDDNDGNATTGVVTPVTGTVVTAVASNGTVYTDTTDAMGYYTITVPANMTYTVSVATPAGTVQTLLTGGNTITDTTSGDNLSHDGSGTTVIVGTEDNLTVDFGFYVSSSSSFELTKTLNTAPPLRTTEPLSFTIRITNTGTAVMTTVPLIDRYNNAYLEYVSASPAPDIPNPGELIWQDLTAPSSFGTVLNPGETFEVIVEFLARLDTTILPNESTVNIAVSGDISDSAEVPIFVPTSVELASREVIYEDGNVILRWETADESDITGFHVYRQIDDEAPMQLTNVMLVAEKSGSPSGMTYSYADETAQADVDYRYFVGILNTNGVEVQSILGDVITQRTVVERSIYLPFITK